MTSQSEFLRLVIGPPEALPQQRSGIAINPESHRPFCLYPCEDVTLSNIVDGYSPPPAAIGKRHG